MVQKKNRQLRHEMVANFIGISCEENEKTFQISKNKRIS